jgi:protein SCO1/2
MSGLSRGLRQIGLALLVLVAAIVTTVLLQPWLDGGEPRDRSRLGIDTGTTGPGMSGRFSLQASDGRRVTDADFRGRWLLVFFGYTGCPDICPTTLQTVTLALNRLGDTAERLQPVFITVDPERDTPERIAAYLDHFHPSLVGLGGSVEEVTAAARGFGVHFEKSAGNGGGGDYPVDHTAGLFLFDPEGRFEAVLREQDGAVRLAERLGDYL